MAEKFENKTKEELAVEEQQALTFCGCFQHSIDDKGRVSVPASFRQLIESRKISTFVLTNFVSDGARCLEGYALPEWQAFEQRLKERSRFDPKIRKLENFYLARATYCTLDGSGRILLAPYLRTYAGLTKEVVFTSSLHGFRLWDKRVWELIFQEAEAELLENPALFIDLDT